MVGQGVLRECLLDDRVTRVVSAGRSKVDETHAKLTQLVEKDLFNIQADLRGFDACFFSLGLTSAGMTEDAYRKLTYELTIAIANKVINPKMTFCFVSGAGTDSTERGRTMWARVKGAAENALLNMPFKAAYMFRPAFIIPMHGIESRTKSYRIFYKITRPLFPLMRKFPKYVTTTEQIGKAMITAASNGAPKRVLESADINALR